MGSSGVTVAALATGAAGSDLATFPGGKGANQAVAAAKLGAEVVMVSNLGDDMLKFGTFKVTLKWMKKP